MEGGTLMSKALPTLITSLALVAMLALAGCGGPQASSSTSPHASSSVASARSSGAAAGAKAQSTAAADAPDSLSTQQADYIGEDAAKAAALKHVGVPETSCNNLTVALDETADSPRYDISFNCNGLAYYCEVDALTAAVLAYESEIDNPDIK